MISEKKLIGISVIEPSEIEIRVEELVTLTIDKMPSGGYCVAEGEKEVIEMLLEEILENAGENSTTFLAVKVPRRREAAKATPPELSPETRQRRRRRPSGGAV